MMKRRSFILTLAAIGATKAQDSIPFHSIGEDKPRAAWFYDSDEAEVLIDPGDYPAISGLYDAFIHMKKDYAADTIILTAFYKTTRELMGQAKPTELLLAAIATAPFIGPGAGAGIDKPLRLESKPVRVELKILKTVGALKLKA